MNRDIFELLSPEECYSKTHGNDFFETYHSHVNLCLAFVDPVLKALHYNHSVENVQKMVAIHDIGKRGREFQNSIRNNKLQYIRHEELAFIKWLDGHPDLKNIELPYILAILAHHKTLIDTESAIIIERFISDQDEWKVLSRKWLNILKRKTPDRIDNVFLSALPLIDILRTVDILASFTSETVYQQYMRKPEIKKSLYEAGFSEVSKELSCINLRTDEIKFNVLLEDKIMVKIDLTSPVNSVIEYVPRGKT